MEPHGPETTSTDLPQMSSMEEQDNPSFTEDEVFGNDHSPRPAANTNGIRPDVMIEVSNSSPAMDPYRNQSSSTLADIDVDTPDSEEGNGEPTIIYSRHDKVLPKDFATEVRGSMDIQRFINQSVLLLDLNETNVDKIMDELLKALLGSDLVAEAKSHLFTHDDIHQMRRTLQSSCLASGGGFDYDQSWICTMCSMPTVPTSKVGIARLRQPANFGTTAQEIFFIVLVVTPTKEKSTKTDYEIGRTFATLFSNSEFRQEILHAYNEEQYFAVMKKYADKMSSTSNANLHIDDNIGKKSIFKNCGFMNGILEDLRRRIPHYISDYKDGVIGHNSIQKTLSTSCFLFFAILLPSIAFGVLNSENTNGMLNVKKVIFSQIFGGLVFALYGGTPQIVLLTTAPLALYTKIIFTICEDFEINFVAMFGCVGLWNTFFLFIYSFFDLSVLMRWSTRSSEEIFALFISIAFSVDAFKSCAKSFSHSYNTPYCDTNTTAVNVTLDPVVYACDRENSVLYLFLMFGTLWLGVSLFNFKHTPYLTSGKREIFSDYALPVSVIIMSFVGAYLFKDVDLGYSFQPEGMSASLSLVPFHKLSVSAAFAGMGLGFCLSLLFFMDQNISAALVNAPQNKMKKGTAYHWDLFVVGIINGILSLFAFPWVHAALPHSPLHVLALADVEERVEQGHVYQRIVYVRETRLTAIISHVAIGFSLFGLRYLAYIPTPVLYGLFLYVAVTALYDNQMFERISLLFKEQAAYPPNHYIRRVPQRKIHLFTGLQVLQLIVLCAFGFAPFPYLKMFFPMLIFSLIPIRHKLIPFLVDDKFLRALDSH